jgi:hypothetical protein
VGNLASPLTFKNQGGGYQIKMVLGWFWVLSKIAT